MSEEDRNRMAVLFPGVAGNLNGAQFDQRASDDYNCDLVRLRDQLK